LKLIGSFASTTSLLSNHVCPLGATVNAETQPTQSRAHLKKSVATQGRRTPSGRGRKCVGP